MATSFLHNYYQYSADTYKFPDKDKGFKRKKEKTSNTKTSNPF